VCIPVLLSNRFHYTGAGMEHKPLSSTPVNYSWMVAESAGIPYNSSMLNQKGNEMLNRIEEFAIALACAAGIVVVLLDVLYWRAV